MTNNEIVEMAIQGHSSTRDAIRWAIEFVQEQTRLDGIHTCHDKCERPACVAVREAVIAERQKLIFNDERVLKSIGFQLEVDKFIKAIEAEREACAKLCESLNEDFDSLHVESCAEAIRARGQQ